MTKHRIINNTSRTFLSLQRQQHCCQKGRPQEENKDILIFKILWAEKATAFVYKPESEVIVVDRRSSQWGQSTSGLGQTLLLNGCRDSIYFTELQMNKPNLQPTRNYLLSHQFTINVYTIESFQKKTFLCCTSVWFLSKISFKYALIFRSDSSGISLQVGK